MNKLGLVLILLVGLVSPQPVDAFFGLSEKSNYDKGKTYLIKGARISWSRLRSVEGKTPEVLWVEGKDKKNLNYEFRFKGVPENENPLLKNYELLEVKGTFLSKKDKENVYYFEFVSWEGKTKNKIEKLARQKADKKKKKLLAEKKKKEKQKKNLEEGKRFIAKLVQKHHVASGPSKKILASNLKYFGPPFPLVALYDYYVVTENAKTKWERFPTGGWILRINMKDPVTKKVNELTWVFAEQDEGVMPTRMVANGKEVDSTGYNYFLNQMAAVLPEIWEKRSKQTAFVD